ncbi:hypothetical protein PIB30_107610, partial [Stylosanthes scabra]|nr:hypothetical protein [Stylosanthes scabra]
MSACDTMNDSSHEANKQRMQLIKQNLMSDARCHGRMGQLHGMSVDRIVRKMGACKIPNEGVTGKAKWEEKEAETPEAKC